MDTERLPQWIQAQDGTLLNLQQITSIQIRPNGYQDIYNIIAECDKHQQVLASFTEEEVCEEAYALLARTLPIAIISMDLDIVASVEREK